jgi:hypothetical protein
MAKRLRIPAGVVVRGEKIGGRFVSVDQLAALARKARKSETRSIQKLLTLAKREERRAAKLHQRAADRFVERQRTADRELWLERKRQQDEAGRVVARIQRQAERRGRKPRPLPPPDLPPEWDELEAPEWEFSCEYSAASRGHGGHGGDVDVNIRLSRIDRAPIRESEARTAFRDLRATGGVPPDGYRIAGVEWRNPKGARRGWRSYGDPYANLANLWNTVFNAQSARLGAVKIEDDELEDDDE